MTHPSSLDLEAFACGETSVAQGRVGAHVEGCSACGAFVEELRQLVSGGTAAEADALVARALARVTPPAADTGGEPGAAEHERPEAGGAGAPVISVGAARLDAKRRLWLVATSVITPLAAAAAILLLARGAPPIQTASPTGTSVPSSGEGTTSPPDRLLIAPFPVARPTAGEPDTTFKGGMQIAVVRERAGEQARFSSPVGVRPGDRLRVEVALDREQAILGAVLADDGSYLELMPQAVRGPGTHFSERSAKIDASPTFGTIVIGTPEAVARARETRRFDGVASLRVEWEGTP